MTNDLGFGNLGVGHSTSRLPQNQPSHPPKRANFAKYQLYFANRFAIFAKKVMGYRAKSQSLTAKRL